MSQRSGPGSSGVSQALARVGELEAVVPTVRGRAWITGITTYLLDPDDPFPAGFLFGEL